MIKVLLLSISLFSFASLAENKVLIENVTIVSSHLQAPKIQMNVSQGKPLIDMVCILSQGKILIRNEPV